MSESAKILLCLGVAIAVLFAMVFLGSKGRTRNQQHQLDIIEACGKLPAERARTMSDCNELVPKEIK